MASENIHLPAVENPVVTAVPCGACGCPEFRRLQIISTAFGHVARLECYDCGFETEYEIVLASRDFTRNVTPIMAVGSC
jgi:uncharacterized ferredoxin-like protein